MKTYTFHVRGMHCNACVILTESELSALPGVSNVQTSLKNQSIKISGDFGDKHPEQIARDMNETLQPHGYTLSVEAEKSSARWSEFTLAIPLAFGFIALFIALQKVGIVNLVTTSEVGYGTAFAIGLIASVSTCMAVVGGLTLSLSAHFAKEGSRLRPHAFFHIGRLVSFFVLGGTIGALGSVFQLGQTGTLLLNGIVALVLIVLGVNLLDTFPWAKKLQPSLPRFIGKRALNLKRLNHALAPLLIGAATFFLPCGFTQSMQIYTLTTGSFFTGAITMFSFALGTLPVLALLSISSLGIQKKASSGIFFKTAGLVVILFGILNLLNAFAAAGFITPIFNF